VVRKYNQTLEWWLKCDILPMSWYTDSGQPGEGFLREAKITSCTGIETPAAKFFVIFGSVKNTYTEIKGKEQVQHYPFHYIMHLK